MAGFDTIIEGDKVDPPISTRGNASLYNESPMAKLLNEYMTEASGNSLSSFHRGDGRTISYSG